MRLAHLRCVLTKISPARPVPDEERVWKDIVLLALVRLLS